MLPLAIVSIERFSNLLSWPVPEGEPFSGPVITARLNEHSCFFEF